MMPNHSMEHTEAAKEPTAAEAAVEKPTLWGWQSYSLTLDSGDQITNYYACLLH
jgi:hypothetical protein